VPLSSRVTLGGRFSLLLCITQFVLYAREGAPRGVRFPYLEGRELYMVGTSFVDISPCKPKK